MVSFHVTVMSLDTIDEGSMVSHFLILADDIRPGSERRNQSAYFYFYNSGKTLEDQIPQLQIKKVMNLMSWHRLSVTEQC